jgi:hypothetical protein
VQGAVERDELEGFSGSFSGVPLSVGLRGDSHNILASKSRSLICWSGPPVLTNNTFRLNKITLPA